MSATPYRLARGRGEARPLPPRWGWLVRGFQRYALRYLRRHFHAVRLSRTSHAFPAGPEPVLVALNHSAWWDPLVGVALTTFQPRFAHYGAIDTAAVGRYAFFERVGFVGVDGRSLRGAVEFLRAGEAILSGPNRAFWVTAQGRFSDVRERPLALRAGVGHLAARLGRGVVLPLAIEYAFWAERTPEALVRFGPPIAVADHPGLDGKEWTALIERELTETLDGLNRESIARDPALFEPLLSGKAGIGGAYDWWRRAKSWSRGRRFDPSHAGGEGES